jgi:hypothetical protein
MKRESNHYMLHDRDGLWLFLIKQRRVTNRAADGWKNFKRAGVWGAVGSRDGCAIFRRDTQVPHSPTFPFSPRSEWVFQIIASDR